MSRLQPLIDKLERGERLTQADLDAVTLLQALDVANAGSQFVQLAIDEQRRMDEQLFEQLRN